MFCFRWVVNAAYVGTMAGKYRKIQFTPGLSIIFPTEYDDLDLNHTCSKWHVVSGEI